MRMTKTQRVAQLEKAIKHTIDIYGIKLITGEYIRDWSGKGDDICGCAIGAAILSTAKDKEKLLDIVKYNSHKPLHEFGDFALEIINDGITKQDLIDFEAGYEGWNKKDASRRGVFSSPFTAKEKFRSTSLFYKAGVRLAKQREQQKLNK
jgi:hypothetical protein